jgi:murein DD-endopeptidase MepM/ murein hydrolase activator NlpD
MHGKRLKLIYFSTGGSEVKEFSLGWKKISLLFSGILAISLLFVFAGLLIFTDVFQDVEIAHLKKTNTQLEKMLGDMEAKVKEIEQEVLSIEKDDKDLRVFVDLDDPGDEARQLGRGGLSEVTYSIYATSENELLQNAQRISQLLDNLDVRMNSVENSRGEILSKYNENDDKWRRIPSIRPVEGGRLSAQFGWRIHPLTGKQQYHEGLDIAAPRGTPIYAPADGTVESVIRKYRPNQSYGRQIVIDHGNGIKTRYAHLKNVNVHEGEKVTRFTPIGTVGDTGRSTGPHLHYEVLTNDVPKNPYEYILQ